MEGIDVTHPKTNYVGEPGVFVREFPLTPPQKIIQAARETNVADRDRKWFA